MKTLSQSLAALVLITAASGSPYAAPVALSELIQGANLTAGDKVFTEWKVTGAYTNVPQFSFDFENIQVTPLDDGDTNPGPGLRFDVLNDELHITGDGAYAYKDLTISFKVTVFGANLLIADNSLGYVNEGAMLSDFGDNGSYVHENIGTAESLVDLAVNSVEASYLDGTGIILEAYNQVSFTPHESVYVTKNIVVWASGANEEAALYGFYQRFSQVAVPEPATVLLFGVGLAGAGLMRRRRG